MYFFIILLILGSYSSQAMTEKECQAMGGLPVLDTDIETKHSTKSYYCKCGEQYFVSASNENSKSCKKTLRQVVKTTFPLKLSLTAPSSCPTLDIAADIPARVESFCVRYAANKVKTDDAERFNKQIPNLDLLSTDDFGEYSKNIHSVAAMSIVPKKAYLGCPGNIEWRIRAAKLLCNEEHGQWHAKSNLKFLEQQDTFALPKALLFFFDGFGDFSPEKALAKHKDVNGEVVQHIYPINITENDQADFKIWSTKGYGSGLRELRKWVSGAINNTGKTELLKHNAIQFHYHSSDMTATSENPSAAKKCMLSMNRDFDDLLSFFPNSQRPKLIVGGYSNGGAAAMNFQNDLGQKNIITDLLLTVDPVPRLAGYVFNLKNEPRHANTVRHINFFQREDHGSIPYLRILGQGVDGADDNILLRSEEEKSMKNGGEKAHRTIIKTDYVKNKMTYELAILFSTL